MNSNMRNFAAEYVFREYPKWVTLADGSRIIVNDKDEEEVAVGDQDDREALMAKAKELGLAPHHKAGIDKLKEMIASAEGK